MNKKNIQKSGFIRSAIIMIVALISFSILNNLFIQVGAISATKSAYAQTEPAAGTTDQKTIETWVNFVQDRINTLTVFISEAKKKGTDYNKFEKELNYRKIELAEWKPKLDAIKETKAKEEQAKVETISGLLNIVNKEANLPSFTTDIHKEAATQAGARQITSAVYYLLDFIKYIIGGLAVIYIAIAAISIILNGKGVEEVYNKHKMSLTYILIGLIVIILADTIVEKIFFGQSGEILQDVETAKRFATQGAFAVKRVYTGASYFAGAIAVLMMVYYGVRMLAQSSNEEEVTKSRKAIMYAGVGLAIIGLSELLIKGILFKDQGTKLGYTEAQGLIMGITNFIASFIGILSVVMFIYAGVMYVANFGNEEATTKAKSIMTGAVIGILLALGAFAIATTIISFGT
ncbi:pilin [Patescibacteria group bacterium]|nr:pilin [Patescibacteria group bacterium]